MSGDPQMPEPGGDFRSSGTPGGRWGCIVAGAFLACCLPLILILTWKYSKTWAWILHAWLPVLLATAVVGIAVRATINMEWRRSGDTESGAPAWMIIAAVPAVIVGVVLLHFWFLST